MKFFTQVALAAFALLASSISSFGQVGARETLAPNVKFQGDNNTVPTNNTLRIHGTLDLTTTATAPVFTRRYALGTPIVATTNTIVTTTNMKVGSYTVAASPDVPRNITVTMTGVGGNDTPGTVLVTGTDNLGVTITETLTPVAGSTVAGTKAFKTVTSVVGAGWVINSTNDTIVFGVGNLIGLPTTLLTATGEALTTLSTTVANSATTGSTSGVRSLSTVDASGGTYNGSKNLTVYLAR